MTRRQWIRTGITGGVVLAGGVGLCGSLAGSNAHSAAAILKCLDYSADLRSLVKAGFKALGIEAKEIRGKRILLKPNLVEVDRSAPHVNTHPHLVRAAADAFMDYGAERVVVAEGSGHCMDSILVFETSGLREALREGKYRFIDLNYRDPIMVENTLSFTSLARLAFPDIIRETDWIVSMPKMKTHHWAGVTLSMKNCFGFMPGCYYGWPKNILHQAGIDESIVDISLTLKPQLAIVDGIVGMEGDGPIMGTPIQSGVIVMGRELPGVDATCARIMDIDPFRVVSLNLAHKAGYSIAEDRISQRGELIETVKKPFQLLPNIPAQKHLRDV